MNRRGLFALGAALVGGAITAAFTRRRKEMPDFENMSCAEIWDFLNDPGNDPLARASALSAWEIQCAETYGPWPQSGGTIPPRPPKQPL